MAFDEPRVCESDRNLGSSGARDAEQPRDERLGVGEIEDVAVEVDER